MSQTSIIGMILYLLLAIFGGFLTGLFSRYIYQAAEAEFGKWLGQLCSVVFYVVPVWAFLSLFKDDDLDVFYLLLIFSFVAGVIAFNKIGGKQSNDSNYSPYD